MGIINNINDPLTVDTFRNVFEEEPVKYFCWMFRIWDNPEVFYASLSVASQDFIRDVCFSKRKTISHTALNWQNPTQQLELEN